MGFSELGPALKAGLAFWRTALQRAWGALLLLTAVSIAGVVESAQDVGWTWVLLTSLAELLATVLACGALFRLSLKCGAPGPAGLQWNRVEWRILGAMLLTFFLIVLILLALVFVIMLLLAVIYVGFGAGSIPSPKGLSSTPAGQALIAVGVLGGFVLLWVLVRLSLAAPATVDRNAIKVFSTWPLSRGRTPTLFVIAILLGLTIFLRIGLPMLVANGVASSLGAGGAAIALRVAASLVGGLVQLPILVGALSHVYRRSSEVV